MIAGFIFLLFFTGGNGSCLEIPDEEQQINTETIERGRNICRVPDDDQQINNETIIRDKEVEKLCNFQAIVHHLNLTKVSFKYTMSRPVINNSNPTDVYIAVKLYAILNVREIDQTFISYIWVHLIWQNQYVKWEPNQFCGIKFITIPTAYLWMPDIVIEEMTEKDKASQSPYLTIVYDGSTEFRNDQVVVSTCKMQVYKFPFDSQSCNLSFRSIMHDDTEIKLQPFTNETKMREWSLNKMHTQYEWLYQNMSIVSRHDNFIFNQTIIVYTITMKRRSVLYIANFILPILFFLTLDLASFLISDTGGEKLSFKVTVLLAVTVMQLLLNEILPSSSDSIPLIAVYCIGIFTLMLLSLLETVLVMHLIEKDSALQDETDGDRNMADNYGVKEDNHNFQSFFRTFTHILKSVAQQILKFCMWLRTIDMDTFYNQFQKI
ncbi:5-hydroxytryptamine receptor 3A-like [Oreochromis aureus]|uniref:5-hydroxytryptamine receptor 3A-like n=1 Tax=Oreochromis aureus TaxID=47969 RepID=UPI001952D5AD|nr:5-hydroxytryptamine receptor 3A-like [Oreochromis aureus]